jgi:hypothetical protein
MQSLLSNESTCYNIFPMRGDSWASNVLIKFGVLKDLLSNCVKFVFGFELI